MENIEEIIKTIQMTPEQQEAFDTYIGNFLNEWKSKMEAKVYEESTDTLTREYNEKAKKFEGRLRKSLEEEITEELTEKIGKKLIDEKNLEVETQVKEAVDVLNDYYHKRYELFCQETVSEIENTLHEEQKSSPEVTAFRQVVNNVSPFVAEKGDKSKLIDTLEAQDKTIRALQEKLEEVTKDKMISECVSLLPENMKDNMRKFLDESCETAEQVVDKFEHAVEFIKESDEILEEKDIDDIDDEDENLEDDDEDDDDEDDDEEDDDEEDDEDDEEDDDEDDDFEDEDDEDDDFEDEDDEDDDFEDEKSNLKESELFDDGLTTISENKEGDGTDEGATDSITKSRMLDLAGINK